MGLAKTFIKSFSADKARGYIIITLFLFGAGGWGSAYVVKGQLNETKELCNYSVYKFVPDLLHLQD